jgi:hypothetical protein
VGAFSCSLRAPQFADAGRALRQQRFDMSFNFACDPRNPALPDRYPLWKLSCLLKSVDLSSTQRDVVGLFQIIEGNELPQEGNTGIRLLWSFGLRPTCLTVGGDRLRATSDGSDTFHWLSRVARVACRDRQVGSPSARSAEVVGGNTAAG